VDAKYYSQNPPPLTSFTKGYLNPSGCDAHNTETANPKKSLYQENKQNHPPLFIEVKPMEETVKALIREAKDDYEDGEMLIEVVEGRTVNGEEITVKATIDEYDFIRLYGEQDFKILMHNGEVGDVIGEGKWYRAKIIKQNR
jgi:hypothetical protein